MNGHCNHLALKFSVCVKERQDRLPTMYWLPKLHKTPYKARFIANSSSCTTTELSKLLTSCLTAVKNDVIRYCEKIYERSFKNLFWSIKNSGEVLNKLKSRGFRATSLSTYDFSTLYTTLPHNLAKEKLINLIEWTFKREGSPYIACNERQASCLTAVKNHVIRYCEKVYERSGKNLFWSIKNSGEVLNKLKSRGFRATSLSTYDFSTLYTTLPHNLIKEKLINLIEWTFKREGSPYIACNERQAFFTSEDTKRYKLWSCQNVCEALIYLLDNIYIRFGTKLYRQIVGIPMGTYCAPLVADLFLFCYERDFMTSLSDVKQSEIIEAFYLHLDIWTTF